MVFELGLDASRRLRSGEFLRQYRIQLPDFASDLLVAAVVEIDFSLDEDQLAELGSDVKGDRAGFEFGLKLLVFL